MQEASIVGDYLPAERSVEQWAEEITEEWRKSVQGIVSTGKILDQALISLPHGSKVALYERLPFSEQTARKLRAIGRDARISKRAHVRDLPSSWGTLYELTQLDDDKWEQIDDAGLITPDLERKDIAAFFKTAHVSQNTGNNEWYTPPAIIEAARQVMGGIDLDPASSEIANAAVRADRFYSEEENGLEQEWEGNVWMNPPYAQPLIQQFCEKLAEEYIAGNVTAAIVLVNNGTETKWGQTLLCGSGAVCFPSSRIRFVYPSGELGDSPLQGQMILYFGENHQDFIAKFSALGICK